MVNQFRRITSLRDSAEEADGGAFSATHWKRPAPLTPAEGDAAGPSGEEGVEKKGWSASKILSLMLGKKGQGRTVSVIDNRHMWLAKRVSHSFSTITSDQVEKIMLRSENLEKVDAFLGPDGPNTMFCLATELNGRASLVVTFDVRELGSTPVGKTMFFVRNIPPAKKVSEDICRDVIAGQFGADVIKSFSVMLANIHVPLITAEDTWGLISQDERRAFFSLVSRFAMSLTDVVETIDFRASMKLQDPNLPDITTELDKIAGLADMETPPAETLEKLTQVAAHWKAAAEAFLDHHDPTLESFQDVGPDAPLRYWRERLAHLNGLHEQFESTETVMLISILTKNPGYFSMIESWHEVEDRLREAVAEANDNVKHLTSLNRHFEVLYTGTPQLISEELSFMFSKLKIVRVMSKYLQDRTNMTGLLVKITNQMIGRCRDYLNESGDIWGQDPAAFIAKVEECLQLNHQCQVQYRTTKHERTGALKELPFIFDEDTIFAKFQHFSADLRKLAEIFKAKLQFDTLASQSIPGLDTICEDFASAIQVFRMRPYDPLHCTSSLFDRDCENMRAVVTALELDLQEFIHESFLQIESTDQALDLLGKFHALLQRESLRPYLNTKYLDIFNNFSHDLDVVQNIYETLKDDPPTPRNAPPVARRILWVRHTLKMIEVPMQKFRNQAALMISKESKTIVKKYNRIAQAFVQYEVVWERAWGAAIEVARESMSAPLLVRHPDGESLHVNFDKAVLQVIREAKFLRQLQIDIPPVAEDLLIREASLNKCHDTLKHMLREYEEVMRKVPNDLKQLFVHHLRDLYTFLRPGMTVVTWNSLTADGYVTNMMEALARMHDLLDKVKDLHDNRVLRNLRCICRMCLVNIPTDMVTTEKFISEQEQIIKANSELINLRTIEIESAINDIIDLVSLTPLEPGKTEESSVYLQLGAQVIEKLWNQVHQAILTCIKSSITSLKMRVRSSSLSGLLGSLEKPFFKVSVELLPPQIRTNPNLDEVQSAVNRCALAILRSVNISAWKTLRVPDAVRTASMSEMVLMSAELVPSLLVLTGCIQKTRLLISNHIDKFLDLQDLWLKDKKKAAQEFLDTNPSIEDYVERLTTDFGVNPHRCRANREHLTGFEVFLPDIQGRIPVLTVLSVQIRSTAVWRPTRGYRGEQNKTDF